MSELEERVKNLEDRLEKAEALNQDFKDGIDVLSDIIDTQQATLQRHIVEVTDHFSDTLTPRVRKLVKHFVAKANESKKEKE